MTQRTHHCPHDRAPSAFCPICDLTAEILKTFERYGPQAVPPKILEEIAAAESKRLQFSIDEARANLEYAAYFPHYCTGSPGYHGPLVVTVDGNDPVNASNFIKVDGRWMLCAVPATTEFSPQAKALFPGGTANAAEDYEADYDRFWKTIIEKDGLIDMDAVKRELFDYHNLMRNATQVYCHVTRSRISKLNTDAAAVCAVVDDIYQAEFNEDVKELAAQPVPPEIAAEIAKLEAKRIDISFEDALAFMVGDEACAAYLPYVNCGLSGYSGRLVVIVDPLDLQRSYCYAEHNHHWEFCASYPDRDRPHPKVRAGLCKVCGHHGDDCTGIEPQDTTLA